jgi:hypothetical protein
MPNGSGPPDSTTAIFQSTEVEFEKSSALERGPNGPLCSLDPSSVMVSSTTMTDITKRILKQSVDIAFEQMIDSGTIHTILTHAIDQVTCFESSSSGEYSTDGYTMDSMKTRQHISPSSKALFFSKEMPISTPLP